MSEEGEDNWQWHQRMEQETGATSGKQDNTQQYFQEDRRAEIMKQTEERKQQKKTEHRRQSRKSEVKSLVYVVSLRTL
jgi:hypothetical protein